MPLLSDQRQPPHQHAIPAARDPAPALMRPRPVLPDTRSGAPIISLPPGPHQDAARPRVRPPPVPAPMRHTPSPSPMRSRDHEPAPAAGRSRTHAPTPLPARQRSLAPVSSPARHRATARFLCRKDATKSTKNSKGVTILSKLRSDIHNEIERLLLTWIKEKQLAEDSMTETIICEKASRIYNDLEGNQATKKGETSTPAETFKASRGWLDDFKKRTGIHSVVMHGEASSSNAKAAADFVTTFASVIAQYGYIPKQVFNCDDTGLLWKKMPRRTFITAEEKRLPRHKPMKNWLTLVLCANASGDCKVKPLLVYHSENPRAFKSQRILKEKLQVMWRTKARAWVIRHFFTEWVNLCFGPAVKKDLAGKKLSLKCLLVLDNVPGHPPGLEEDILDEFMFIKVLFGAQAMSS
ncbi:tigger transposable element-derived protein 1-like [Palaemon carinicauda]|uniref:tigger transposable element-derived protein 1-like n=1 Tax=Palaemon carinicauda TaxID=392227 RepID=UPI0035B5B625